MDNRTLSQKFNVAPADITVTYCEAKIASATRSVERGCTSSIVAAGYRNILLWTAKKQAIIAAS